MSAPNLSLWQIEESILGLSEIIESPDTTEEEKQAARAEIERWAEAEVAKVDRVRAFLRHCKVMEDAAKFEAMTMKSRGERWGERAKRLKEICMAVMDRRGVKRLEGQSGVLRIQVNGGKVALKITNEGLVPEEYVGYHGYISSTAWRILRSLISANAWDLWSGRQDVQMERRPMQEAMRKILETKCPKCEGMKMFSEIGPFVPDPNGAIPCEDCGGTGHMLVPGAELEERGQQLRVE